MNHALKLTLGKFLAHFPHLGLIVLICFGGSIRALGAETRLSINKDSNGSLSLKVVSPEGSDVVVEATDDLSRPQWQMLAAFRAAGGTNQVYDPVCGRDPIRFYRMYRDKQLASAGYAENFRLTDSGGASKELFYHWTLTNIHAFVLVFITEGCPEVEASLPALRELHDQFKDRGVRFWMVESGTNRSRVTLERWAKERGIPWPVFHDRSQSVAASYGVRSAPEVVCVNRETMDLVYRGAVDNSNSPEAGPVARHYLKDALEQFLAGKVVEVKATPAFGCEIPYPARTPLTYTGEIGPILERKCVTCHSPGNIAPWAMTNYNIVRTYAPVIKSEVLSRRMPPWHPDPHHGKFLNDRSLTPEEEFKLVEWINAGAPRGEGPDYLEQRIPPPPGKWPEFLGPPDWVVKAPIQTINAQGEEPYRYVFVDSGLPSNVWVKAAIVKPSNLRVTHHILVWEGRSTQQQAAGLALYVPGDDPRGFPAGTGVQLNRNVALTFNLHYTPSGSEEVDEPEMALWFHASRPAKTLYTLPVLAQTLAIPPYDPEHKVSAEFRLPLALTVYRLSPHMHYRGLWMRYEAIHPNGTVEVLLNVPKYAFDWQTGYWLQQPKTLPAGTRLRVTGAFDNSPQNVWNPDPARLVEWGDQSWEEMFIGYVDYSL